MDQTSIPLWDAEWVGYPAAKSTDVDSGTTVHETE